MLFPIKDDNPTTTFPFFTILLIAINVAVFFYQFMLGPAEEKEFIYKLGAIPYEILHIKDIPPEAPVPMPLTLLTAIFLHGGLLHLLGNMWFLWLFGNNVEDFMGHFRFLFFYLLGGLAASMIHVLVNFSDKIPMVGASGAIAGVMGAYMILYPRAKVHTLVFLIFFISVIPLPALLWLGIWFLMQVLSAASGGGVAWFAHIGGFIVGIYIAAKALKKKQTVKKRAIRRFKRVRPPTDWMH